MSLSLSSAADLGFHLVASAEGELAKFERVHAAGTQRIEAATVGEALELIEDFLAKFPGIFGHTSSRSDGAIESRDVQEAQSAAAGSAGPSPAADQAAIEAEAAAKAEADAEAEKAAAAAAAEAVAEQEAADAAAAKEASDAAAEAAAAAAAEAAAQIAPPTVPAPNAPESPIAPIEPATSPEDQSLVSDAPGVVTGRADVAPEPTPEAPPEGAVQS